MAKYARTCERWFSLATDDAMVILQVQKTLVCQSVKGFKEQHALNHREGLYFRLSDQRYHCSPNPIPEVHQDSN